MSKVSIIAPKNRNYAATVVALKDFVDLPNCNNVKAALIFGNSVIVSKYTAPGEVGLFFPVETQLSKEFLSNNSLYRKVEYGNVTSGTGFFEQHGRVKAMKFRGHKSEGFFIPLSSLEFLGIEPYRLFVTGDTFDNLNGIEICRKYVPKGNRGQGTGTQTKGRQPKLEDSIVDGQFSFHFDTENLRRNAHKVKPDDIISITDKWHGTSVVVAKVLVKRPLSLVERLLKRLGVSVKENEYGLTYSSRRVIKAVNGVEKNGTVNHYYTEDIWGVVAKEVADKIPNGFSLYGEIVGFTPSGEAIQSGYHYGCEKGQHKFLVYRVTLTTIDGLTVELSWPQLKEFCTKYGLEHVTELYYGLAVDVHFNDGSRLDDERDTLFGDEFNEKFQADFLEMLESELVSDMDCFFNPGEPAEGIVLRIDRLNEAESYKLKNFRFLEKESKDLDKGVLDTETAETLTEEVAA